MARIRSIKPEFWVSEQVAECSIGARLTFIGLWNFSDDNGVHPAKPKTLKAELYPMDAVTPVQVEEWIEELMRAGLVARFEAGHDAYWHITGWAKHQKIDKPSAKHPVPPTPQASSPTRNAGEQQSKPLLLFAEDSANPRRAPPPGVEGSGEEVSEEAKASSSSLEASKLGRKSTGHVPTIPCPYDAIVDAYHEELPSWPRVRIRDGKLWVDRQKAMREFWGFALSSRKSDGTRRAESAEQALQWIRDYFARARDNDFLMGRIPRSEKHKNWRPDLDHLLSESGKKQVIEKTEAAA